MRLPHGQELPPPEDDPADDDPDPVPPLDPLQPYGPAWLRPGRWFEVGRRPPG